jgi:hypothetical protein
MRGRSDAGEPRALTRWRDTKTLPWLVAALWHVKAADADAESVLAAAAEVPAASAAFATVSYLRTRLLIARGDFDEARELLSTLPDTPTTGFPPDAINLLRSSRLRVAQTMDEWLRAAPRMPIGADATGPFEEPAFDVDAAVLLSEGFPLSRLVEIAQSRVLPDRLRLKVAIAAWTRAVQLNVDSAGLAVAPILRSLAPPLRADLERYVYAAGPAERHAAGILLLLRWPGMRNDVPLAEEETAYRRPEPRGSIARDAIGVNWWCGFDRAATRPAPPSFLSTEERAAVSAEWQRLARLGPAATYLATEAVAWAQTRPRDAAVPEALARAVAATRFVCGDDQTGRASQRAFAILHARYPNTAWAKQTPYWYNGR